MSKSLLKLLKSLLNEKAVQSKRQSVPIEPHISQTYGATPELLQQQEQARNAYDQNNIMKMLQRQQPGQEQPGAYTQQMPNYNQLPGMQNRPPKADYIKAQQQAEGMDRPPVGLSTDIINNSPNVNMFGSTGGQDLGKLDLTLSELEELLKQIGQ